jgi:hypothetical protein
MTKHQDVAKALNARLSELKHRVAEIERELHAPLPADSEDQATDLENQEALEAVEKSGIQETREGNSRKRRGARADLDAAYSFDPARGGGGGVWKERANETPGPTGRARDRLCHAR